jgi:outer membrane murein-binding lipoprotein Lpp
MPKFRTVVMIALCASAFIFVAGCSNSPSDEELRQLQDLQAQAKKLEDQVVSKQSDNAALEKENAEKNGKLQQCQSDQEAVKKAMGGK